jgi:capsule polysaccharide export protein KpsE/RkpR
LNPRPLGTHELKSNEPITSGPATILEPRDSHRGLIEAPSGERVMVLMEIWRERRFIFKAIAYGFLVALVVSLLIPPRYQATTRLMPPEKQGLGGLAALMAAAGGGGGDKAGSMVGGLVSDAMGVKSPSALYVGVLKSSTVQDDLINRFDLRKVYRDRYMKDAREDLADYTDIDEDRKNGIITVTVSDRSPERAMRLARAYVEKLNSLMADLDTSAAHRERVFLDTRLKKVKDDLDQASKEMSDFSSQNLTLDVKEQGKAIVAGVATLEGQLIAAESQLSGLQQIYTPNNVRVKSIQARVDELRLKLAQLRGNGPPSSETDGNNDVGISIAALPKLGLTYYDLYRRVKIQETVFEILTKQYELAKVNEAKELPTIRVLDEAALPESKSTPKRFLIILIGTLLVGILATAYVVGAARIRNIDPSDPFSLFGLEMREGFAEDLEHVRDRFAIHVKDIKARVRRDRKASADD